MTIPTNSKTLTLDGSFDAESVAHLRPVFDSIASESGSNIVIDMSNVSFIDSSGIGGIVFLYKRLVATGRTLSLYGVQGQPLQLLEFLRIPRVIPILAVRKAA